MRLLLLLLLGYYVDESYVANNRNTTLSLSAVSLVHQELAKGQLGKL